MRLKLAKNKAIEIANDFTKRGIFKRISEKDSLDSYKIGEGIEHRVEKKAGYLFNVSTNKKQNLEACVIQAGLDLLYEIYDKDFPTDQEMVVELNFVLMMMVINGTRFGKRYNINFEVVIDNWLIAREEAKKK